MTKTELNEIRERDAAWNGEPGTLAPDHMPQPTADRRALLRYIDELVAALRDMLEMPGFWAEDRAQRLLERIAVEPDVPPLTNEQYTQILNNLKDKL